MNLKSLFLLIVSVNILLVLVISTFVYIPWQNNQIEKQASEERSRAALVARLGLPSETSWEEVNHYVDCEIVKAEMYPQEVELRLKLLLGGVAINPPRRDPNLPLEIVFPDTGLQHRRYFFKDEKLDRIYLYELVHTDSFSTLAQCGG